MEGKILVVDDDPDMQFFLKKALDKFGATYEIADAIASAKSVLSKGEWDLVLLDYKLPDGNGLEFLPIIQKMAPEAVIVVMTAYGSKNLAMEALKAGAYDYFTKPFKLEEMEVVIKRALERSSLLKEIKRLRTERETNIRWDRIIGNSSAMQEVFHTLKRIEDTDITVLITGESGTGKELIAEAIHRHSKRKDKPFVKLNCVAIPEGLLESELFGYERGAFTGAIQRKKGKFELAHGGTIFLDEIGDMTPATQAKILRVLQDKVIERVGGSEPMQVDVRIIAATNKDLNQAVKNGAFREDLFFRLNVMGIHLPPLRKRPEDIPLLVEYFIQKANKKHNRHVTGLTREAMGCFLAYYWPGNVREMENLIERLVVMSETEWIGVDRLPETLRRGSPLIETEEKPLPEALEDIERALIIEALTKTSGVQAKAAKKLGISERSLWHRVKKLGIDVVQIRNNF